MFSLAVSAWPLHQSDVFVLLFFSWLKQAMLSCSFHIKNGQAIPTPFWDRLWKRINKIMFNAAKEYLSGLYAVAHMLPYLEIFLSVLPKLLSTWWISIYIYMKISSLSQSISIYICIYSSIYLYLCLHLCVYLYISSISIHISIYVCMHVCNTRIVTLNII